MSKKVAIITPVFPPYCGGIGSVALNHARILIDKGQDVIVFVPDYGYKHETPSQSPPWQGGEVCLLEPVAKYGNAAYVPQLCSKLRDYHTVILQYPFFGGMRAVYKAKKKYKFKLILNYNMDVVGNRLPARRSLGEVGKDLIFWYVTKYFLPRIVKHADIVLASSEDYAKHSDLGKYWSDDKKFKVLPIGVDVSRFKPFEVDEEFKKNLNIKPDEKIVLFVGGLDKAHYFKGVEYLIRAVEHIKSHSAFKIVIVGRGELQQEYRKLAEKLNVKDKIMFTGGISDNYLVKLYQMAYVTVLPSIDQSESFGIVLAESMACGTPVIASNLPGVRSVFEDGVTGFVSAVRDEKNLAEKISFILNNPEKEVQMRDACVKLVQEKYDWNKIADKFMELL
ncbi:glycosyltransferase family 4 protein [Patescibacteria group bacterium]|nr:glycosyltransferase family 4 protein [Patescibacteria group bacterium]